MAFLTDPSISAQVRVPSLADTYLKAQAIKAGQQEQQARTLSLAQAMRANQDELDTRSAIEKAGDITKAPDVLATTNPFAASKLRQQVLQQQTAAAAAQAKLKADQLANTKAQTEGFASLMGGVDNAQAYAGAIQTGVKNGYITSEEAQQMPAFSPEVVQSILNHAMTVNQQVTADLEAQKLAETKRAHDLEEQRSLDTSTFQGKYIRLQAKKYFGQQLTPEEQAFVKGYEKNVDLTKTQPGVMRAEIYAQSVPVQVYDPNTGTTTYTNRRAAMGQQAPSTIQNVTDKAVLKDFTSGKAAQNLTAFNTASEHLSQLDKAVDALHNGDIQAFNRLGNEIAKHTGNPAPTNFQAIKTAVAGEISKTFKGGQATDAEIKEAEAAISAAGSPAQLKQVIKTYRGLMASKRNALKDQFDAAKQGRPNFGEGTSTTSQPAKTFNWNDHPVVK